LAAWVSVYSNRRTAIAFRSRHPERPQRSRRICGCLSAGRAEKAHGSRGSALLIGVLERNWHTHLSVRRAPTGRDVHFGEPTQGCALGWPWAIRTAPLRGANARIEQITFYPSGPAKAGGRLKSNRRSFDSPRRLCPQEPKSLFGNPENAWALFAPNEQGTRVHGRCNLQRKSGCSG